MCASSAELPKCYISVTLHVQKSVQKVQKSDAYLKQIQIKFLCFNNKIKIHIWLHYNNRIKSSMSDVVIGHAVTMETTSR